MLVEIFSCLLAKLDKEKTNVPLAKELKRKYRSLNASDNKKKKEEASAVISTCITAIWEKHRDDIMSKDFSFVKRAEVDEANNPVVGDNTLVIDGVDIGVLYLNALDSEEEDILKIVHNELLYLFYQIAPEEDQKEIDARYKKAPAKAPKANPGVAQPTIAKQMEKLLQKNSHKLKKAEKDPNAIPEVLADFFSNNSNEMAGMLTGMLGTMGIDPTQMAGK